MYKNQLQELAQRSCFNLPSYSCIREGPDHAPRFKATVNFNGEAFESPSFCTTLRQAEHAAAEVALNALSTRGPFNSLAARILDETGVYKNLLQEIAQRVGAPLPSYTTVRSGLGHLPVFTGTVELAGITFTGEPAKNKKQAEKNAAMAAWYSLKKLAQQGGGSPSAEPDNNDEQEQITIARALLNYRLKEKMAAADNPNATPFPKKFPMQPDKRPSMQPTPSTASKILPLIRPKSAPRTRPCSPSPNRGPSLSPHYLQTDSYGVRPQKFPGVGAAPYVPIRHCRPFHGVAPPVTVRTSVPVFSAPPLPPPNHQRAPPVMCTPRLAAPLPVRIRQAVPVFAAAPHPVPSVAVQVKEPPQIPPAAFILPPPPTSTSARTLPPPTSALPVEEEVIFPTKPSVVQKDEFPPSPKPLARVEKTPMTLPCEVLLVQLEEISPIAKPPAKADGSSPPPPNSSDQTEEENNPSQKPLAETAFESKAAAGAAASHLQEQGKVIQSLKQIEL